MQVFVSVGRHATPGQRAACDAALAAVAAAGLRPRLLADDERSAAAPLPAILRIVDECDGMLVLAHARYEFAGGVERVDDGAPCALGATSFPTVWNQIEAAFAYARGQSLLVVCEAGLKADGLLEGGYGWPVFRTEFTPAAFAGTAFAAELRAFGQRVLSHAAPRKGGTAARTTGRE